MLREMVGGEGNRLGGWRELQWGHPEASVLIRVVLATCCVTLARHSPLWVFEWLLMSPFTLLFEDTGMYWVTGHSCTFLLLGKM